MGSDTGAARFSGIAGENTSGQDVNPTLSSGEDAPFLDRPGKQKICGRSSADSCIAEEHIPVSSFCTARHHADMRSGSGNSPALTLTYLMASLWKQNIQ